MALDNYYHNKIEAMQLEILKGQAVLRRLEAQRNDYNSRVRLLREELGLLQQPGSYVGEVVKVMGTKKVLVKVHPEGKYGMFDILPPAAPLDALLWCPLVLTPFCPQLSTSQIPSTSPNSQSASASHYCRIRTNSKRCCPRQLTRSSRS